MAAEKVARIASSDRADVAANKLPKDVPWLMTARQRLARNMQPPSTMADDRDC
ncbi:hypothetical protein RBWH47_04351 [Rhodopirellula baltica WH47]|uniref:Uncharacterized protein n=1 Tax=Rhodopirellula baltica WH47 TaxID=991778 RepID=F2APV9_RHOBT|nr:hypothetical protein RBWH47_04351 [Rhodopirellula baltica WH47]